MEKVKLFKTDFIWKEEIFLKDGTKVDDDMLAAILVATIDYRKERKEDVKVISCKLIEDERKK